MAIFNSYVTNYQRVYHNFQTHQTVGRAERYSQLLQGGLSRHVARPMHHLEKMHCLFAPERLWGLSFLLGAQSITKPDASEETRDSTC